MVRRGRRFEARNGPAVGRSPAGATPGGGRAQNRRGMSLVELIIAIIILAVGMLGLAGVSIAVLRQMRGGSNQTIAASIAHSRFEQFEGRPCAEITGGTATTRGMTETWVVEPVGIRAMSVRDTVRFQGLRGTASIGIHTVVSCQP